MSSEDLALFTVGVIAGVLFLCLAVPALRNLWIRKKRDPMTKVPGDSTHDNSHMTWKQWPKGIPRPTEAEWAAADKLYKAEMSRARERGYYGDGLSGLSFMMATYSKEIWWGFFFPEEDEIPDGFKKENQNGFTLACRPSWYYKTTDVVPVDSASRCDICGESFTYILKADFLKLKRLRLEGAPVEGDPGEKRGNRWVHRRCFEEVEEANGG